MPKLELFASSPGTGKTYHCIQLFRDAILKSRGGIDSRSFFILPSREHAERIQNLVLGKTVPGLFNAHILTINDLAARFLGKTAFREPTDAIRRNLIREILRAGPAFRYFNDAADCEGFYEILVDAVKEFKSELLSVREFERLCQPLLKDTAFRLKFKDLTVLLKRYEEALSALGLREPEETIAELLGEKEPAQNAELVIFDGFYHFTRAQRLLIEWVARRSEHMAVTLTLPPNSRKRLSLLEYPERTRAFLKGIGFKEAGKFLENRRTRDPALRHLEKNIFLEKPALYTGKPASLKIFEAYSPRAEAEMIAREVKRLYREEAIFLSDICIILRDAKSYEKILRAAFGSFDLSVHVHERKKIIDEGFSPTLYRFLNLVIEDCPREDLLFVMKSGYWSGHAPLEDVLLLEAAAVRENISGGRKNWERLFNDSGVSPSAVSFLKFILGWCDRLLSAGDIRTFDGVLLSLIHELDIPFSEGEDSPGKALAAIRSILDGAKKYYGRAGERNFSSASFARQFQDSLKNGLFSLKSRGKNRVQVYDAVMAMPKEYKVVFAAGLLEKVFPKDIAEDPLLKDAERAMINKKGVILEERRRRIAGERYFFYMTLGRARERLYLSYPLYDAEGRSSLASFFVEEVRKCFREELPVVKKDLDHFLPEPEEWENRFEITRGLAQNLNESGGRLSVLRDQWSKDKNFGEVLEAGAVSDRALLKDEKIKRLFREFQSPFSPTGLEAYAACAFKYFSARVLNLNELPENRQAAEMGTVLHRVLEEFYKGLSREELESMRFLADEPAVKKRFEEILKNVFLESPLKNLSPYRKNVCLLSLKRTLGIFWETEKERFGESSGVPAYFELGFGMGKEPSALPPLCIPNDPEDILVRGYIDRIDLLDDGKKALVIDYKSSERAVALRERLEKGMELQLPLYLLVAERLLGLSPAGAELRILKGAPGEGIYREEDRELLGIGKKKARPDSEFRQVTLDAESKIREYVSRLRSGDISIRSKSCQYCQFSSVCRFETWKLIYE